MPPILPPRTARGKARRAADPRKQKFEKVQKMDEALSASKRNVGAEKARFSAETLLLRLPCGGELFGSWRFPVEHDHIADEFDKGADAFGGVGFFCPRRGGDNRFEPCPRLVHLGHLLAAENFAPDEAAATAEPADGDADEHSVGESVSVEALDAYPHSFSPVRSLAFDSRHKCSSLRRFLAERARKRREWGKCREDFPNKIDHAADSSRRVTCRHPSSGQS